ncbi:ATPase [uncultured phage cr109_1]|uniref:Non-ATPase regulatory subunit n=1 Tax=uncultured phage cr109_1 TaxID=2772083 RepID=A0A7M1RRZ6_9CAUD|nr:ATPase [uncultured phage cr109_1]QOR57056.1 non-ATPase regulatory subunit [uncultured phage cr109_1]
MAEFVKIGNEILVKPKLDGLSYDLIKGKVYDLKYNRMEGRPYLQENGDLNMPKKLYKLKEDDDFIKRVLTYFNSENSGKTTGVLLSGTKGTGKTMLSKRIALESNLPIIIVATDFPVDKLNVFFKKFETPVVIVFDEIEKNDYWWETKDLLGFLDGVEATAKKLVLMTCNKPENIDENFFDRCSRVRYFRQYEANSNSAFVRFMAEDKGVKNIDEVVNFINNYMQVKSFDNISAFIDEAILFEDIPLADLAKNMNISTSYCYIDSEELNNEE